MSMSGAQTAAIKGLADKLEQQEDTIEALTQRLPQLPRAANRTSGARMRYGLGSLRAAWRRHQQWMQLWHCQAGGRPPAGRI